MESITRLTRAGKLREATAAIQKALRRSMPAASARPAAVHDDTDVIDVASHVIPDPEIDTAPSAFDRAPSAYDTGPTPLAERTIEPLIAPFVEPLPGIPGDFVDGSFTNAAGTRHFKLYIPGGADADSRPMVVMLHGCKQNPGDFAAGTRMNELAQAQGWVVLYPGQQKTANQLGCWNWFQKGDQQRGLGEPSIIADMTRRVIADHGIDPDRVYVAGLSAGGAMAAIMATTYPELFAAAGIHSGLPHAAANDLVSALMAMKKGPSSSATASARTERVVVPTIVFHGDRDTTVHPCNGEEVIAQARFSSSQSAAASHGGQTDAEQGQVPGGRSFTRRIHRDESGRCDAEHWIVHGAGHAWSGGSGRGSYTDPLGPDASKEMLRFFTEHPHS
jgi:poly(hydroxyalkanoate) depolymerase family esterase